MNWETLLCFGDSITFGARSYLAYPEICGDILMRKLEKKWNVINHAVNGYTVIDLLRSLNPVLEQYRNSFPGLITVMIGTNDIKQKVDVHDFEIAYQQLIVKLRLMAVGNHIMLLKIPRFAGKVFYPYNFGMNEQIGIFNQCIERMANENGLRFFEFHLEDDDFFDGVHLSPKGCQTAAVQLADVVLRDKGIEGSAALS